MKKLSIICALVMVFGVSLVQAQQYEVAPAGSSPPAFITTADVAPGGTVAFDIYQPVFLLTSQQVREPCYWLWQTLSVLLLTART